MSDGSFAAFMAGQDKPQAPAQPTTPKPKGGSFAEFMAGETQPAKPFKPSTVLPQDRQTFSRQPRLGFDNPRGITPSVPQDANSLSRNAWESVKNVGRNYVERPLNTLGEAIESAQNRDWRPLGNIAKSVGRGALKVVDSISAAHTANPETAAIQDPAIQQLAQERVAGSRSLQDIQQRNVGYERFTERNPSRAARFTRGAAGVVTAAIPVAATGALSGGSIPAMTATAGLMSAGEPSEAPLNMAMAALPAPVMRRGGGPTRGTPAVRPTQPMPQILQGRATAKLPQPAYTVETAPTAGLSNRLPVRETLDRPPQLVGEDFDFGVRENLSPPRQYAGARGPRFQEELQLQLSKQQAQAAAPPVTPPVDVDASLGKLWRKPPEQASLFKGAPSEKVGWLEKISTLRRAGLLTSPSTHARNVVGTWANQAVEEVSRIPSSIVDLTLSAFTRRRTVTGPSATAMARAGREAATKGRREALDVLRTGATPEDLGRLQLSDVTFKNPIARAYTQTVFRSLSAADRVANAYAYKRSLLERARAQAITEARGNRNINVAARAQEIAANPSAEMAAGAVNDALVTTFNNENLVNRFLSAGKQKIAQYPGGRGAGFAVDTVAPFVRTPTNAVARVLEYSGGGFIKGGAGIAKAIVQRSMTPAQQRAISQTLGRATTGTAGLITLGYILASNGYLTGFSEEDEGRRNRDIAAGRQPGSIYDPITGQWRKISGFAPVSSLLLIGATIHRERERSGEQQEKSAFERYGKIGAQVVGESPLAIGSKDVATALTRPGTLGEKAGSLAGSFIPSAISGAGAAIDDKAREGKGFVGRIQSRVPYWRESLPEATDVLGRPLEPQRTGAINPIPGSTAKDKSDPLMAELTRLDVGITGPQRKTAEGETVEAYRDRKAKAGEWFVRYAARLMASDSYRRASRDEQKAAFARLQRNIHDESDSDYPNTERFNAGAILEAVKESAYRKREKERLRK